MGLVGRIDFKDPSLSLPTSEITGANNKTHSIKSGFIIHGITSGNLTGSMCFLAYSKLMCKKAVNIYIYSPLLKLIHTVDGGNPAPVDMVNIPLFIGFYTSQVVQDFFHQQYLNLKRPDS